MTLLGSGYRSPLGVGYRSALGARGTGWVCSASLDMTVAGVDVGMCPECLSLGWNPIAPNILVGKMTALAVDGVYSIPFYDRVGTQCSYRRVIDPTGWNVGELDYWNDVWPYTCPGVADGTIECTQFYLAAVIDRATNAVLGAYCSPVTPSGRYPYAFSYSGGGYVLGDAIPNALMCGMSGGTINTGPSSDTGTVTLTEP